MLITFFGLFFQQYDRFEKDGPIFTIIEVFLGAKRYYERAIKLVIKIYALFIPLYIHLLL